MHAPSNPHGFEQHKLELDHAQRSLENFNEHQADTRKRVDTLARLTFAIGGGALTVSLGIFLRSGAPTLSSDQAMLLHAAWWCLFGSMMGFALVLGNLIVQANFLAAAWRAELDGAERPSCAKWERRMENVTWFIGLPAFFAFLAGLGFLAWLATSLIH